MISETFQMVAETGNNRNLTTSSGCQVTEAGRPVRRLRRKRRLPLDSEDEDENAYEDEVNGAACTSFKESCDKQGQWFVWEFLVQCKLGWGTLFCTQGVVWVCSWFPSVMGISVLRSHRGEWIAQVKQKSGVHSNNTTCLQNNYTQMLLCDIEDQCQTTGFVWVLLHPCTYSHCTTRNLY